jgi:hypothetical protein
MELSSSDGIALLALMVGALSAISASNSANSSASSAESAILANRLAQHNERLRIYKALQKFYAELNIHGHTLPSASL